MTSNYVLNNTPENWPFTLAIIVGAVILNKLLSLFKPQGNSQNNRKTANRFDNILFTTLETPLLLGIMLVCHLGGSGQNSVWARTPKTSFPNRTGYWRCWILPGLLPGCWFTLAEEYLSSSNPKNAQRKVHLDIHMIAFVKNRTFYYLDFGWCNGTEQCGGKYRNIAGAHWALAVWLWHWLHRIRWKMSSAVSPYSWMGLFGLATGLKSVVNLMVCGEYRYQKHLHPHHGKTGGDHSQLQNSGRSGTKYLWRAYATGYHQVGTGLQHLPKQMQEAIDILKSLPGQITGVDTDDVAAVFGIRSRSALVLKFIYHINSEGNVLTTPSEMNLKNTPYI